MIIDRLENFQKYVRIKKDFKKAFAFICETNFQNMQDGVYDVDGDKIFAIVSSYETKNSEEAQAEAHRKFIDLQFVVSGKENMGYKPLTNQEPATPYNKDTDVLFFDEKMDFIRFEENMFALLFPEDLHMPGIKVNESEKVKKVVVKIAV